MRHGISVILATLIAAACSYPAGAQSWRVDSKPFLDISATRPDGSIAFSLAVGASRFATGAVIIADAADAHLTLFDSSGRAVSTIGRKGQGPGEFGVITWMGRCSSDSVFAWDLSLQRMTVISVQGAIVNQAKLPAEVTATVAPYSLACSRNGVLAALGWGRGGQPDAVGITRATSPLVLFDLKGQLIGKISDVPTAESIVSNAVGFAPRPLGRRSVFALSSSRLFLGTADSAVILSFDLQGGLREVLRISETRRRPTQQHKDLAIEPLIAFFPRGSQRDHMRQALRDVAAPADLPPYSAIFADPNGLVWIQTSFSGDKATKLEQVSPSGRLLGTMLLPANVTVFEVGVDYVLGKFLDANDEEHVAVYRVHAPAR